MKGVQLPDSIKRQAVSLMRREPDLPLRLVCQRVGPEQISLRTLLRLCRAYQLPPRRRGPKTGLSLA